MRPLSFMGFDSALSTLPVSFGFTLATNTVIPDFSTQNNPDVWQNRVVFEKLC